MQWNRFHEKNLVFPTRRIRFRILWSFPIPTCVSIKTRGRYAFLVDHYRLSVSLGGLLFITCIEVEFCVVMKGSACYFSAQWHLGFNRKRGFINLFSPLFTVMTKGDWEK